jgi:hypothetical protein
MLAAVWMVLFLYWWFREPVQAPDLKRSDLWLMMADTVLGVDDSNSDAEASLPASGLQFLPQRLQLLSWAFVILCLACCHGLAVVRWLRLGFRLYKTERIALIGGIGLAVQSLITLVAGLAGQLNPIAICLPLVVSLLAAWRVGRSEPLAAESHSSTAVPARPSGPLVAVVLLVIVPFAIYLLLGSLSPPTDFDVREYHLQGPKEWFQQGRISYLRHNVYTSFPFLSEMLPLSAMVLIGDWWEGALAQCLSGVVGDSHLPDNAVDFEDFPDRLCGGSTDVLSDQFSNGCLLVDGTVRTSSQTLVSGRSAGWLRDGFQVHGSRLCHCPNRDDYLLGIASAVKEGSGGLTR